MKLKRAAITITGTSKGNVHIILHDREAGINFAEVEMSAAQFSNAVVFNLGYCSCEIEVRGLDVIGKKMEVDKLVFEISNCGTYSERVDAARQIASHHCPDDWIPDECYGSQDSFFYKDDKLYAKTTIRRWVDIED